MSEKIIELDEIEPIHLFGINNAKLRHIQQLFPGLKIVGRGSELRVFGERSAINIFYDKVLMMIDYYNRFNSLTEEDISRIVNETTAEQEIVVPAGDDFLLYGNNGRSIKPLNAHQRDLVKAVALHDLILAIGPAGTGKTYVAIALAVQALKEKKVKRIILTRPAVEAGENLGFLPGDLKEKLDPYLQPVYDALYDMIPSKKLIEYFDEGLIQIAPLAYMRGRTLSDCFMICDEAQNTTFKQLKMLLTRMGRNARFIITGDVTQVDLPAKEISGLAQAVELLDGIKGIGIVRFGDDDIVRHALVKEIVRAFNREQ